jgi:hypothetical protein
MDIGVNHHLHSLAPIIWVGAEQVALMVCSRAKNRIVELWDGNDGRSRPDNCGDDPNESEDISSGPLNVRPFDFRQQRSPRRSIARELYYRG